MIGKVFRRKYVLSSLVSCGMLVGLVTLSDPRRLPLPLLVLPFMLLFAAIYFLVKLLLSGGRMRENGKRATMIASVMATAPVLLLVFQSMHQLTIRDVLVTAALIMAVAFYISRADFIG